jgi:hypothetical protein
VTDEDRDKLEGRVNRELREAEAALKELLARAEQVAADIASLSELVKNRAWRARMAGGTVEDHSQHGVRTYVQSDAGIESGHLKRFEKVVDLQAIDALDREIGQAVANAIKARQQKERLGV